MKTTRTCSVDGCERGGKITRGLCGKHYQRQWKSGNLAPIPALTRCSVEGCEPTSQIVRGMCIMHYHRWQRLGTTVLPPGLTIAERLAAGLVRMPNGCLEWTKNTHRQGYGMIRVDGKNTLTHRLAWTLANGPIPEGLEVCHHCDNPPCCDVEKCLFLGTHAENMADKAAKGKAFSIKAFWTHCPRNHPFDEINTHVTKQGRRRCIACRRARDRARYALRRTP